VQNILIPDEIKTKNGQLVLLVSIVLKNEAVRQDVENALDSILRDYNSSRHARISILYPGNMSASNIQEYTVVLGQIFNYFKVLASRRDIQLLFNLTHAEQLRYGISINLEQLLNEVMKNGTLPPFLSDGPGRFSWRNLLR
jgi:hypothetical protein